MASSIVEVMVPGIHELIRGHNFRILVKTYENLEIKHLENRALYGVYICMYCLFYGTFTHVYNNAMNSTFHAGWSGPDSHRGRK